MKHYQLILAAALIALAACNKDKVDNINTASEDEIGFNAVASMNTKAIISGTTYGHENSFKVWGWQSQEGDFSEFAADDASNFMSNLEISWNDGFDHARDEAWRNANHYYYWPFTGKISFLAIHPSTVVPTSATWDATNKKPQAAFNDYTITPGSNETVDLMVATNEGSRRTDALPMVFKHALSQIVVNVKTNDNYTHDVKFDINSVQFNNIDLSGDATYINEVVSWSDNTTQTQNWMYYSTIKENINNVAAIYGAAKVMIPQPANADNPETLEDIEGTTMTISYTMTQHESAAITGTVVVASPWKKVKEGDTVHNPAVAISGWEPGKKYVYTLNFKLNEILFNPSVTDWVEVDMTTTTIYE